MQIKKLILCGLALAFLANLAIVLLASPSPVDAAQCTAVCAGGEGVTCTCSGGCSATDGEGCSCSGSGVSGSCGGKKALALRSLR